MKRITISGFLCLLILSCALEHKKDDKICIAIDSEPVRINPLFLTDLNSHMVSNLIYRGLTTIDKSGRVIPEMADSWEIKNGGREIIFKLKANIYWHDGQKFSSEDVVFTYKVLTSPKVPSPKKGSLGPIREIKAIDPKTVVVIYNEPYGSALESWTLGILPRHLGESGIEFSLDNKPIGTGPYKLVSWSRGQHMVLEAFQKFYSKIPNIDKVVLKFIADPATRYLELRTGKIDAAELPLSFDMEKTKKNLNEYRVESFRYTCLGFNLSNPLFASEKFRQAIAYAINKEEIINVALFGKGRISLGPYPRNVWYYNDNIQPIPYNPQIAKNILRSLQVNNLRFSVSVNAENREAQRTAQLIQEHLKRVGINMEIRLFDWQTLRHRIMEEKDFDSVILSRAYLWDPDIYDLWHSSKAIKGGWNLFSFKDEKVDSLLEEGRKTTDLFMRSKIYKEVQKLLYEKQACVFLYETPLVFLAKKNLTGIDPNPQGFLYGLETWTIIR
ncbi:MAG: ABC transporter substrate-binding protein [Deltaproteobacteria bacterium]|nr:ABC transporter substrate-binding protein [Deltaproteobacteria bacterium]